MRVLYITGEYPPLQGGVGDCTREIARALASQGVETHVLTSAPQPAPDAGPPTNGEELRAAQENGSRDAPVHVQRLIPKWTWAYIPLLDHLLRAQHFDIVHLQYQTAAFGMHPAINVTPRLLRGAFPPRPGGQGVRSVVTFHDVRVPYLFPKAGPVRRWVTSELARQSDGVIATNAADRVWLQEARRRPVDLIPIGSNIHLAPPSGYDREAWRARLGVGPDEFLLAYFGFLNDSKGGEDLVRALAEGIGRGLNARLVMIGGQVGASDPTNALYLAAVKGLMDDLGVTARVLWTDYCPAPEISGHFLAADLAVLPYRDGASFRRGSLMAALAHGLPIVTTTPPSGQNNEPDLPALRDGENVALVPPRDPHALAEAILRLAADPARRAAIGQGARETAAYFSWDRIAAQHVALYRRLLYL